MDGCHYSYIKYVRSYICICIALCMYSCITFHSGWLATPFIPLNSPYGLPSSRRIATNFRCSLIKAIGYLCVCVCVCVYVRAQVCAGVVCICACTRVY